MTSPAVKSSISTTPAGYQGLVQTILMIDDDRAMRAVISMQLEHMGYKVIEAGNGAEALEALERNIGGIDIILLDREMPVMNGMEFIQAVKEQNKFTSIPIIMVTGSGQPSHVTEGIQAGVFYYLIKPIHYNVLSTIVSAAMRETQRNQRIQTILQKQNSSFSMLTKADFSIQSLEDAEYLSVMLANCFTDPNKVFPGLLALMANAIEHGNLEIGFEEKDRLISDNKLTEEIQRRMGLFENKVKKIHVTYEKTPSLQIIKITDTGKGFDWQRYINKDPSTITGNNGRGIAMAKIRSFDQLSYNQLGHEVTAVVHLN